VYTTQEQLDVAGVYALFEQAVSHKLKYPKIRLETAQRMPVVLSRAGDRSKYTGQIMVTDGQPYGSSRYYGRVDLFGIFHATDSSNTYVSDLLQRLSVNPVAVASEYGKLTGNCCFCQLALKDARSTAVGYGPICAEHYGLSWGVK
jgi:hypothetical protein